MNARASAIAVLIALAGCSGGGGGSDNGTATIAASSVAVQLAPETISIKDATVLATTDVTPTATAALTMGDFLKDPVKVVRAAIESSFPSAHAAEGSTKLASRKLVGNVLSKLNTTFSITKAKIGADGKPMRNADGTPVMTTETTSCAVPADTEVVVQASAELLPDVYLIQLSYPDVMHADCTIGAYTSKQFIVDDNDRIYSLENTVKSVVSFIPYSSKSNNTSGNAIIVGTDSAVWEVALGTNKKVELKKLPVVLDYLFAGGPLPGIVDNSPDLPGTFPEVRSSFAFDGTTFVALVGAPFGNRGGMKTGKVGDDNLKVVIEPGPSNTLASAFIDDDNEFIVQTSVSSFAKVNKETGALEKKWSDAKNAFYIPTGRFGKKVMDVRCQLLDIETGLVDSIWSGKLEPSDNRTDPLSSGWTKTANRSYLKGNYAFCVDKEKTRFVRMDMRDNSIKTFDAAAKNLVVRRYTLDRDTLTIEVAASTTESRYLKTDFNTGETVDLGVIRNGDRKVVQLLALGR